MKHMLATTAVSIILWSTANAQSITDLPLPVADRYISAELVTRTLQAYPACLNYCVTQLEVRAEVTPLGVSVFVVPVIAHNNPDLLVMSNRVLGNGALLDWEALTGSVQAEIRQGLLSVLTGLAVEAYTGNSEVSDFGKQQSTTIQETQIIGNPSILASQLMGQEPYRTLNPVTGANDGGEYGGMIPENLDVLNAGAGLNTQDLIDRVLDQFDLLGLADIFNQASLQAAAVSAAQAAAAGYAGASFRQDSYLCQSEASAFWPYYLSSVDSLAWHGEYPLVDGLESGRFFTLENQVRPSSALVLEDWGWIYPRTGFINHEHSGRAAAVLSKRAAAVAGDSSAIGRLRVQTPPSHLVQKLSPYPSNACVANIADLNSDTEANDAYSYNLWIRYECTTSTRGSLVATIDIEDICF